MANRKKDDAVTMPESNGNPYEADMTRLSAEFSLDTLLETFQQKRNETAARKISINERMETARKNISRLQSYITQLQMKAQSEVGQVFLTLVVRPIAEEIRSVFPSASVDVFGPYGLSGQSTITIAKKNVTQASKIKGADCRSITLVPTDDGIGVGVRDYSEDTREHAPGSLGFLSGLNHPVRPIPTKEGAMGFIVDWLSEK